MNFTVIPWGPLFLIIYFGWQGPLQSSNKNAWSLSGLTLGYSVTEAQEEG